MGKRPFTTEAQAQYHARRDLLKELSNAVKPLVEMGEYPTVNAAIVASCYQTAEHATFNTFWQWKDLGQSVKKGEKGFPVWAQPVKAIEQDPASKKDEYDYWPLCYLFSNAQVEPSK